MFNFWTIPLFIFTLILNAQKNTYQISSIAFYNVENLFDYEDDPNVYDEAYTPNGENQWTEEKLSYKLSNISKVISEIGFDKTHRPPTVIGLAEIETIEVLEKLINHTNLQHIDYGIAHYNSPDQRGIDVALLYDRSLFTFKNSQKHTLLLKDSFNKRIYTRDQLCVSGYLGNDLLYFIVNHWPSRRGGEKRSESKRLEAAKLTKKITDSINKITPNAKMIIMGDFNDNPSNNSFKKILNTYSVKKLDLKTYLYNPMELMYKQGKGSLAYRDKWSLFDQLIFSNSLLNPSGLYVYQSKIFNAPYLTQQYGKYKGYPKRSANNYTTGYSDHYPVYGYLIKKMKL